ncbi:OLC1v1028351C1 [Oldenlandia corymbosa var. corymbosa]|uniref:OLC1v1028351C1 n=1 Tax=Oldenlandia corymbosa var. corymbosa TaxID=529605 RepID=A0AAV1CBJ6_OLDCO|nr:OLC1v1028351C1 [Oldenlandia corymbosa var. corymbosa]
MDLGAEAVTRKKGLLPMRMKAPTKRWMEANEVVGRGRIFSINYPPSATQEVNTRLEEARKTDSEVGKGFGESPNGVVRDRDIAVPCLISFELKLSVALSTAPSSLSPNSVTTKSLTDRISLWKSEKDTHDIQVTESLLVFLRYAVLGLRCFHECQLIHQGVALENVLIVEDGGEELHPMLSGKGIYRKVKV